MKKVSRNVAVMLKRALDVLKKGKAWTTGEWHSCETHDAKGNELKKPLCRYCMDGAIEAVYGLIEPNKYSGDHGGDDNASVARTYIKRAIHKYARRKNNWERYASFERYTNPEDIVIPDFNDTSDTEYKDVSSVFRLAIKLAEKDKARSEVV